MDDIVKVYIPHTKPVKCESEITQGATAPYPHPKDQD